MDAESEDMYKSLLQEICTELVYQVQIEMSIDNEMQYSEKYDSDKLGKINNFDVFNCANSKETHECVCPNCKRVLGALRYAPHLEKCLGMGRVSSRIASRRLLASSSSGKDMSGMKMSDDSDTLPHNDAEWTLPKATRKVGRKKMRGAKRGKPRKLVHAIQNVIVTEDITTVAQEILIPEEKPLISGNICGVVSEHTGRFCNRSARCPKHTDEQRNNARLSQVPGEEMNVDFKQLTVQERKSFQEGLLNKKEPVKQTPVSELYVPVTVTKRSERNYRAKQQ